MPGLGCVPVALGTGLTGVGDVPVGGVGCEFVGLFNEKPGVGSKFTQPWPGKYTCTQLCALVPSTSHTWRCASKCPWLKPLTTRAGRPSIRAMIVMAVA